MLMLNKCKTAYGSMRKRLPWIPEAAGSNPRGGRVPMSFPKKT